MKSYVLRVDGYLIGIVELTTLEVKEMSKDASIQIKELREE